MASAEALFSRNISGSPKTTGKERKVESNTTLLNSKSDVREPEQQLQQEYASTHVSSSDFLC